jgi:hypothetical protein
MLSQLAKSNRLLIKSTCFEHKDIHKGNWKVPGTGVVSQIDHVLVSRRHASSVIDVRSARGPNCDSDHCLVKVLFRERLANVGGGKGPKRIKWNVEKFQQPEIVSRYQEMLGRKLEEVVTEPTEHNSVERKWTEIKKAVEEAAKEVIGEKKRVRNEGWFNDECRAAIEQKNANRLIMMQRETRQNYERYKESRRQANKILREKKRAYLKERVAHIEELNTQNESKKFYQAMKWMTKDFQPRPNSCKDKNGKLIGVEEEVLGRWAEYFEELLNVAGGEETERLVYI